ncbi:hypothetical protein BDZ45DRAFT_672783 [Acephala macrosclerotiorum]|nr:hypothetical protein BDZ45DRAFT_672783 [Acephala macrosclerotiorum]
MARTWNWYSLSIDKIERSIADENPKASGIEVIGCADTSVMPANHPDIFKFSSLAPPPPLSPSSSASSSRCSSLTHRLFTFQGTTTLPKSLCQMPTSIHNVRPSNILFRIWNQLTQIRPCILIGLLFFAFLSLSIFLGVFFTLDKSYGYSMGDAFTLAGFVFGIDACCTPVLFAYHYPHCECRRRGRVKLCTE